ncbi:hypothetical protein B0H14DRAFT_2883959 [Mycena olivaceomarginata]|nr:hypothetical protein B0H14DRAFT_2883959 [Mycena olivaceomarginata]
MREDTMENRRGRKRGEEGQEQIKHGEACMHADVSLACSQEHVGGRRGSRNGSTTPLLQGKESEEREEQELDTALHLLYPSYKVKGEENLELMRAPSPEHSGSHGGTEYGTRARARQGAALAAPQTRIFAEEGRTPAPQIVRTYTTRNRLARPS